MILVVDDSPTQRRILASTLEEAGYSDIEVLGSARETFDFLASGDDPATTVDLILLDKTMPEIDGISACMTIKETEAYKDIPVIIVTASDDDETLQLAFAANANDYITKPFNKLELVARVRSALRLKKEMARGKHREQELLATTAELAHTNDTLKAREQELVTITEELKKLNQQLEFLSLRDGLTGIANRRHFDEVLELEWRRATRHGIPLTLILLDIDAFKLYNDNYGHQRGDGCLSSVARTLKAELRRASDLVARYGGEEFAVLSPHSALDHAVTLAEMLRETIEDLGLEHAHSPVSEVVTVSLGVSCVIPQKGRRPELLVQQADEALYRAKQNGRNQVCVYETT